MRTRLLLLACALLLTSLSCGDTEAPGQLPQGSAGASGGQVSAGASGQGGSGQGGSGQGDTGTAGLSGNSGQGGAFSQGGAGEGGAGQGGAGEAGQGGEAGSGIAGEAGTSGDAGSVGAGAGGDSGAGAGGDAGSGGDAGASGDAGGDSGAGAGGDAGVGGKAEQGGDAGEAGAGGEGGDGGEAGAGGEGGAGEAGQGGAGAGGEAGEAGSGGSGQGGAGEGGQAGSGGAPQGTRLRIMAANLSSGNLQNYDLGHGIRIMQGAKPDVVLIQEFSYKSSSAADLQAMTDLVLGAGGFYYREPSGAGFIPNGILSRYPILDAGIWDDPKSTNREFAWARIDVPGDRDLWAVSVHLLTKDAATRDAEAKALIFSLSTKIPPGDLLTLGGDINADVNTEPCFTTFAQQLVVQPPFPADQEGNENTSANRKKPYDWVLADPNLNALAIPVPIGTQVFPAGLVVDTRVYKPIEDLAPALPEDSAATNMQHMGVVRDFLLPVP